MSGPVTTADTAIEAGAGATPAAPELEVLESREARVGALTVHRAPPQRTRRTVGAWCFLDHAPPVEHAAPGRGIGPHPHIGLQTVTWVLSGEDPVAHGGDHVDLLVGEHSGDSDSSTRTA